MNAKGYIVVVVVAVVLGAWFWMKPAAAPVMPDNGPTAAVTDAAPAGAAEKGELDALDVPDADFSGIDADAQAL